jgi:hypothetical protein
VIQLLGEQIPSVPESFQRRLSEFDRDLYVCWHKSPFTRDAGRWKIERCTRHYGQGFDMSGRPLHDHTCQRVYIMMCQDEQGTPKPLGDWVFEKLREMRHNWETLGGDTRRGIETAIKLSDAIEEAAEQKREQKFEDVMKHNRADKRVQINKLHHLVQQHDVRPN